MSKDFMKEFGVYSVMGNFGSGKTFGTFLEISQLDKTKNLIIANVPYRFVDIFFATSDDLFSIIDDLEFYVDSSNKDVLRYYKKRKSFKNIVIVVDEAHLYFNSRHWAKKGKGDVPLIDRLDILLTQCRKRNIKIIFISQRLKRVDINIRRMTDFVVRYKKKSIPILGIQRSRKTIYENEGDVADIQGDDTKTYVASEGQGSSSDIENSKLSSSQFLPLLKIFWFPIGKYLSKGQFQNFQNEAHNSYYISGLGNVNSQNGFSLDDIIVKSASQKSLTEKEKNIKSWLYKNIPTIFKNLEIRKDNRELENKIILQYISEKWQKEKEEKEELGKLKLKLKTRTGK